MMFTRKVAIGLCMALAGTVMAAPPGPLDGEDIPTDFGAGNLEALQRNYTQFGDYEINPGLLISGNEANELYVAKDANFLYIGVTGNLARNGNGFFIGINDLDRTGQTENRSFASIEAISGIPAICGTEDFDPPWTLQESARQLVIDDNMTPEDASDDTYDIMNFDAGLTFPCDTDYLLAVDAVGGLNGNLYTLFPPTDPLDPLDPNAQGQYDPTPGNMADPLVNVYATRLYVFNNQGAPLGISPIFEQNASGFIDGNGGLNNNNIDGVTDTDATDAATASLGFEIGIPFTAIPTIGPNDEIGLYVAIVAGEESDCEGEFFGQWTNQILPSLTPGSGPCDFVEQAEGLFDLTADLSASASCQTVDLATAHQFGTIDAGCADDPMIDNGLADGFIEPCDYGLTANSALATQACATPFGDAFVDFSLEERGFGSELDALYVDSDGVNLYLGMTGNLEENGNRISIYIDSVAGDGQNPLVLDGVPFVEDNTPGIACTMQDDCPNGQSCNTDTGFCTLNAGDGLENDNLPPLATDVTGDRPLYDYQVSFNISGTSVFVDVYDINTNTMEYKGFSVLESGDPTVTDEGTDADVNQWNLQLGANNRNTIGVVGCQVNESPCTTRLGDPLPQTWDDDQATVEDLADDVTTGFELALPLADIGINPCDGPATMHFWAIVTGSSGFRSNQSLPSMRPLDGECVDPVASSMVENAGGFTEDGVQWYLADLGCALALEPAQRRYRATAVTHVHTPAVENDCNENGIEDTCEILDAVVDDTNLNGVPDECELIPCTRDCDCYFDAVDNGTEFDVCDYNFCDIPMGETEGNCASCARRWGNTCDSYAGFVQTDDILCAVTGFGNYCACPNGDLIGSGGAKGPSGSPLGTDDILAIVAAFGGANPFMCPVPGSGEGCDAATPPGSDGCGPVSASTATSSAMTGQNFLTAPQSHRSASASGASFVMVPRQRAIRAGGVLELDVYLTGGESLVGYEFGVVSSGGRTGELALENVVVDTQRRDYVFNGLTSFPATDGSLGRVGAALMGSGVSVGNRGYVGTFVYRASEDAVGAFNVSALGAHLNVFTDDGLSASVDAVKDVAVLVTAPTESR